MSTPEETPSEYAANVRTMYEAYPFPLRDPKDEERRLVVAEQETLGKLNHFCYAGRQSFGDGFRVLVAGGGTGDHTIFLAEQLRHYDARVAYVDFSASSLAIARERARVRGLENIEWHHRSILDIPSMDIGPFDLVSCSGVLHHLPEPEGGLAALRAVLADEGAMSLMLYGRTGRMAVYAGQELMRLVNEGVTDPAQRTLNARRVVESMPASNWLMRGSEPVRVAREFLEDDSNLNDVLLHEQDRAYSVTEIYELLRGAELELIEFTSFHGDPPDFRCLYDPMIWIRDPTLRAHVATLPRSRRQAIGEAIACTITCHAFYAAPRATGRVATPEDPDMVPFFLYFAPGNLAEHVRNARGRPCGIDYRGCPVHLEVGRYSADLIERIDGERTIGEIFATVRRDVDGEATDDRLTAEFRGFYEPLNGLDVLLLRHRAVAPFREFPLVPA